METQGRAGQSSGVLCRHRAGQWSAVQCCADTQGSGVEGSADTGQYSGVQCSAVQMQMQARRSVNMAALFGGLIASPDWPARRWVSHRRLAQIFQDVRCVSGSRANSDRGVQRSCECECVCGTGVWVGAWG